VFFMEGVRPSRQRERLSGFFLFSVGRWLITVDRISVSLSLCISRVAHYLSVSETRAEQDQAVMRIRRPGVIAMHVSVWRVGAG
jgi:hypothetical protein